MEGCCSHKLWALKLLILGIILILVRLYTQWDIWVVLGVILVIKAVIMFFVPMNKGTESRRKR